MRILLSGGEKNVLRGKGDEGVRKKVYMDSAAEREATDIGRKYMNSTDVLGDMSRAFGTDLSSVRIHTDGSAAAQAAERGVDAFSTGQDVFFARNAFNQKEPASRGLLAHELSHSLQQGIGSDIGSVAQSAPVGAEQGGILDWFRKKPADPLEANVLEEGTPEQAQWVEDDYGEVREADVTHQPMDGPLVEMMHNTNLDGPAQSPVFETHTILPRKDVDGIGANRLHSYIGLRFTQRDPMDGALRRRHIKVGFGSGNGMPLSSHGALLNDWNTQADASTQTPITKHQLEDALETIPQKGNEPYNVLTHNCNTFTKEVATMVGASVPAKLHDTLFGPAGAHTNLANAAAQGEQDRTRFFQGGSMLSGQMSRENRRQLMSGFYETAQTAARRDATPFLLYSELRSNARQLRDAAREMEDFFANDTFREIQSGNEQDALERTLRTVDERGTALMQTKTLVSHPRVNMVTMKTMALAKQLEQVYFPKRQLIQNAAGQEQLLSSLDTLADTEFDSQRAAMVQRRKARGKGEDPGKVMIPGISNEDYFKDLAENVLANKDGAYTQNLNSMSVMGDLLLQAAGLTPEGLIRDTMSVGDELEGNLGNQARVAEMMRRIHTGLQSGDQAQMDEYLQRYAEKHPALNLSQMASTIAIAITQHLQSIAAAGKNGLAGELLPLKMWEAGIARRREENRLDYKLEKEDAVGEYLSRVLATTKRNPNNDKRFEALTTVREIEKFFLEKLRALTSRQEQG